MLTANSITFKKERNKEIPGEKTQKQTNKLKKIDGREEKSLCVSEHPRQRNVSAKEFEERA
jgi:hypothetical protein